MLNSKNGVAMCKTGLSPGVVQRSLCLQNCYCLTDARRNTLSVNGYQLGHT